MKKYRFPVIVNTDEDGVYIVSCATFKGCHSYRSAIDLALDNLREAIEICMEEQETASLNQFIGFREIEFIAPV